MTGRCRQVLFMLAQIGDSQTKLQVIRIMRSLRTYKNGDKWQLIFDFFKDGGITPLCHLVSHPPNGDLRLRVRGDAATELIGLLSPVEEHMDISVRTGCCLDVVALIDCCVTITAGTTGWLLRVMITTVCLVAH